MAIIHSLIPDFQVNVDSDATPFDSFDGEDGTVSVIMRNRKEGITYFVNYIREFYKKFYILYPNTKAPKPGVYESVSRPLLEYAIKFPDPCWIIVIKPKKKGGLYFYGKIAKDWYDVCMKYDSWNIPEHRHTENGTIHVSELRNMKDFMKTGSKPFETD